jgi:hypothetical protein
MDSVEKVIMSSNRNYKKILFVLTHRRFFRFKTSIDLGENDKN